METSAAGDTDRLASTQMQKASGSTMNPAAGTMASVPPRSMFAFSADDWRRPADEVATLMELLRVHLRTEAGRLRDDGARLTVTGRAEAATAEGVRLHLRIAIDDASRAAIDGHGAFEAPPRPGRLHNEPNDYLGRFRPDGPAEPPAPFSDLGSPSVFLFAAWEGPTGRMSRSSGRRLAVAATTSSWAINFRMNSGGAETLRPNSADRAQALPGRTLSGR